MPQMLEPRIRKELLDEAPRLRHVFIDTPSVGTVSTPRACEVLDRIEERTRIRRIGVVLDRREDHASIEGIFQQYMGLGPVQRGLQVARACELELPSSKTAEHDRSRRDQQRRLEGRGGCDLPPDNAAQS